MDPSFWHQRWAKNEIGFHEPKANPLLVTHFNGLSVPTGGRVFVPLCGKTLDIGGQKGDRLLFVWLLGG